MNKKIYLIYISRDYVVNKYLAIGFPSPGDGDYILYAVTDNKSYKNTFINDRVNIFKVNTVNINELEEDYNTFKKKNEKYYLKYYKYKNYFDSTEIKILSTGYEYEEIHIYWFDHIIDFSELSYINGDNYKIFDNKYLKLFRDLNLDNIFIMFGDYDYPQDDCEFSYPTDNKYDNSSLLLTRPLVNSKGENEYHEAIISANEINIFIKLYGDMYK